VFSSSGLVQSVAYSPCGKWIASGGGHGDKTVRIWDAATGAAVASPLTGHRGAVTWLEFRDATMLVSASNDGTTRFWDVESGAEKGQDATGAHGEALAGERFAFAKHHMQCCTRA
jgi:WD40 repeat protein